MRYIEVNSCGRSGDCPYYFSDTDFCRHPKLWNSVHRQACDWDEKGMFPVGCPLREMRE